jgi:hypothetical protein
MADATWWQRGVIYRISLCSFVDGDRDLAGWTLDLGGDMGVVVG